MDEIKQLIAAMAAETLPLSIPPTELAEILDRLADHLDGSLAENYKFVGIATQSSSPVESQYPVFYLAGPGGYPNYGNTVVPAGCLGVFSYNTGRWRYTILDIASSLGNSSESSSFKGSAWANINKLKDNLDVLVFSAGLSAAVKDKAVSVIKSAKLYNVDINESFSIWNLKKPSASRDGIVQIVNTIKTEPTYWATKTLPMGETPPNFIKMDMSGGGYIELFIDWDILQDEEYINGGRSGIVFSKKCYITDSALTKDSSFFKQICNIGKTYRWDIDESMADDERITRNKEVLIDAEIVTRDSEKYTYELAYYNRSTTSGGQFDNAVQIVRRLRSNLPSINKLITINDIDFIKNGEIGWLETEMDDVTIRLCINGNTSYKTVQISNDVTMPTNGKQYVDRSCYTIASRVSRAESSLFYNVETNSGKDFPVWISPDVPREHSAIKALQLFVLYANIMTSDDPEKYTYEIAYINKSKTDDTAWDNTIQLMRRRKDGSESSATVTLRHVEGIKNAEKFWLTYQWDNAIIRLYLDAETLPYGIYIISNGNTGAPANGGLQYFDRYCYYVYDKPISSNVNNTQVAKVIGEKLYIGAKYDETRDILITFEKCMFNSLMTFAKVGLAENTEAYPLLNPDRATTQTLNQASSDNIGPISLVDGGWCGANHSYKEQNTVRTAESVSYEFYADGKKLTDGNIVSAKSIEVRVKNRIFNPTIPPEESAVILSSELCIEDAIYRVENGNIFVSLSHTYTNELPVTVNNYYGMQSMFSTEDAVFTPGGEYTDFTKTTELLSSFKKQDYPNFRRFIERNATKDRYQSTYLLPYEDGNHNLIGDTSFMFTYSSGKSYHHIMGTNVVQVGSTVSWAGLYSWFLPMRDDDDVLVYTAQMHGKTYLFIDAKRAIAETYVEIPPQLTGQEYTIVEKSESITTVGDAASAKGLKFASSSTGTLILAFNM